MEFLSESLYLLANLDKDKFEALKNLLDFIIFEIYFKDTLTSKLINVILPKIFEFNVGYIKLDEFKARIIANFNDDNINKIIADLKNEEPITTILN